MSSVQRRRFGMLVVLVVILALVVLMVVLPQFVASRPQKPRARGDDFRLVMPGDTPETVEEQPALRAARTSSVAAAESSTLSFPEAELCLQIESVSYGLVDRDALVGWDLAEGLRLVLVRDLGASETNVPPGDLKRWGKTAAELRPSALNNSMARAAPSLVMTDLQTPDGVVVASLASSPSCFGAVTGLAIVERIAEAAVVAAFPSWCNSLCRDVDATLDHQTLTLLAEEADRLYDTAATPGVPGLYWHGDGRFERVVFDDGRVCAPAELVSHLAS